MAEISHAEEGGKLEGGGADFVALGDRQRLRAWWQTVSVEELDQLELELDRHSFRRVEVDGESETPMADLNRSVSAGELFAYFVIGPDPVAGSEACKYVSNNLTDRDLLDWYGRLATDVIRSKRIDEEGVDPDVARWLRESLIFQDRKVGARGAEEEVAIKDKARQWAPMAFTYLLWIAIFISAQMLLTSTIEEKSARIIEVLLSSVSSFELMAGKIAGMAAAGLTVVASWAVFIILAVVIVPLATGNPGAVSMMSHIAADPLYLFSFILYFLMGYLFYAAILVGIGSVCNSIKDAQSLMMPVIIPMMIALFALIPISRDPNGMLAKIMSFIPPFTPFVMMNRAAGPPAIWEYITTTLLMAIAIYGAVWAAAKIFRIGVLMTGKPPTVRQMARWLAMDRAGTTPRSQGK
jgi:ABC-2 type transport system permease protein